MTLNLTATQLWRSVCSSNLTKIRLPVRLSATRRDALRDSFRVAIRGFCTFFSAQHSCVQVLIPHSDEMYLSSLVVNAGKPSVYAIHHWHTSPAQMSSPSGGL